MHSRFRTLLLAGAALLGMSVAAEAQTFVNGSPSAIGGVTKFVWNDQNISLTNPLPVAVVSGGGGGGSGGGNAAVTSNGTDGQATSATNQNNVVYNYVFNGSTWDRLRGTGGAVFALAGQYNSTLPTLASGASGYLAVDSNGRLIQSPGASVSVSNFPATQPVSGTVTANVGTTNGLALDATLSGVATTNSAISTATGTTADAATASGANSTIIGALRAIRDKLLGTLTTTVSSSALPTGAATSANQSTEITALQAIQQRAAVFAEQSAASVAASATVTGTTRDAGASPLYSKFNVVAFSNQAGTIYLQGSNDNFATLVGVANSAVTANAQVIMTVPTLFRYNRYVFINGSTAATVSINTSYTAN